MLSNSARFLYFARAFRQDLTGRVVAALDVYAVFIYRRDAILFNRRRSQDGNVRTSTFAGFHDRFVNRRHDRVESSHLYDHVAACANRQARYHREERIRGDSFLLFRRQLRGCLYERGYSNGVRVGRFLRLVSLRVGRVSYEDGHDAQRVASYYVRRYVCAAVYYRGVLRVLLRCDLVRRVHCGGRNFPTFNLSFICGNVSCFYLATWCGGLNAFFYRVNNGDLSRGPYSANSCRRLIFCAGRVVRSVVLCNLCLWRCLTGRSNSPTPCWAGSQQCSGSTRGHV